VWINPERGIQPMRSSGSFIVSSAVECCYRSSLL